MNYLRTETGSWMAVPVRDAHGGDAESKRRTAMMQKLRETQIRGTKQ